ncbi:hypothetical protein [Streptomyces sp. NPDC048338]|uniref:hypothetical protein n=1 Tax=Streptomyces sp. NPDC048338 TaxID=3365536 RepID=UPI003717DFA3
MTRNSPTAVTPDGHYAVVDVRRRRATAPSVPDDAQDRPRGHLIAARRAVAHARRAHDPEAEGAARKRVRQAKAALGERGTPWWKKGPAERVAGRRDGPAAPDD